MPPKAVPLVDTELTEDTAENWVMPDRSRLTSWACTPSALDHCTAGAVGAVAEEAPRLSVLGSVVLAASMLPSGLKATVPEVIIPGGAVGSVSSAVAGSVRTSAYHWLGVVDFRKSTTTLRWPPLESDTGRVMEKSGLIPVVGSSA